MASAPKLGTTVETLSPPKWEDTEEIEVSTPKWEDTEEIKEPSSVESFVRGAADTFVPFDQAPKVEAAIHNTLEAFGIGEDKDYDQLVKESTEAFEKAEKTNPNAYTAGQIASAIAEVAAGGYGLLKTAGKLGIKPAVNKLGSKLVDLSSKTGKTGEALVDVAAKKFNLSPDTIKTVGSLALDHVLGGQYITGFRLLRSTAGSVKKGAEAVKDLTKMGRDIGIEKGAEAALDTIMKK